MHSALEPLGLLFFDPFHQQQLIRNSTRRCRSLSNWPEQHSIPALLVIRRGETNRKFKSQCKKQNKNKTKKSKRKRTTINQLFEFLNVESLMKEPRFLIWREGKVRRGDGWVTVCFTFNFGNLWSLFFFFFSSKTRVNWPFVTAGGSSKHSTHDLLLGNDLK